MKIVPFILLISLLTLTLAAMAPRNEGEIGAWSPEINGLQMRLIIEEKSRESGVRWLVPYLEIRNVRDLASEMQVDLGRGALFIELVDSECRQVRDGGILNRSGPHVELPTITLPHDSSMRISLECTNWGVDLSATAMVSTDSGAWTIEDSEKGRVYLRATLRGEKPTGPPYWKVWHGELQSPLLPVDWE